MAFAMSLPRTKRLKHIDASGTEVFVDDDQWDFLRAANAHEQVLARAAQNLFQPRTSSFTFDSQACFETVS